MCSYGSRMSSGAISQDLCRTCFIFLHQSIGHTMWSTACLVGMFVSQTVASSSITSVYFFQLCSPLFSNVIKPKTIYPLKLCSSSGIFNRHRMQRHVEYMTRFYITWDTFYILFCHHTLQQVSPYGSRRRDKFVRDKTFLARGDFCYCGLSCTFAAWH